MSSPRRLPLLLTAAALLAALLGGPQVVTADGVGSAQRKVDAMLQELEDLADAMGQIDEDYGEAEERQAELEVEVAASQAKIDELNAQLGDVENVLAQIALDRYTSGDTLTLSPIFSDADTYSKAEQTAALSLVAIDVGQTDLDGLHAVADELVDVKTRMERNQAEAAELLTTLDDKRDAYAELEDVYTSKLAKAKKELGEAKFKAEQDRRARAASAKRAKAAAATTKSAPRGGGSGASAAAVSYPAPSGKAGIAVNAALSQLGVPYKFATATPNPNGAFDCSGLTWWAWAQAGVSLPRTSRTQYNAVTHVPTDQAQPGDLIFYYSPIGHVGLYLGSGQMVHAPEPGTTVSVTVVHWNKVVGVGRPR
ncbi:MAG: NlpC/P60 family protein [Actinomycetota bacterium]|nr:NlpC/P60 family protein [Actinomycetota bacterium]